MSTRRVEGLSDEMEALNRGDSAAALQAARSEYRRTAVNATEQAAIYLFFKNHVADVANNDANAHILTNEARSYGGVLNLELLELALLKVRDSLIAPPPPERKPTPTELTVENNKRLAGMSVDQLRQEMQRNNPKQKIATDVVSPELLQMQSKSDVLRLSTDQLRRLMYRTDGSIRKLNSNRITELLQISN